MTVHLPSDSHSLPHYWQRRQHLLLHSDHSLPRRHRSICPETWKTVWPTTKRDCQLKQSFSVFFALCVFLTVCQECHFSLARLSVSKDAFPINRVVSEFKCCWNPTVFIKSKIWRIFRIYVNFRLLTFLFGKPVFIIHLPLAVKN